MRAAGEMEKSRADALTIYASFSRLPYAFRAPRKNAAPVGIEWRRGRSWGKEESGGEGGSGRRRRGWEEEGKKFLGISNTPEVFIAEAGHVSAARRQKFEITCSDVRIPEHTCLTRPATLPSFLSLSPSRSYLSIYSSHPSSTVLSRVFSLSRARARHTLNVASARRTAARV